MALPNISLAQFNTIATGDYNAGQIDFRTDENGTADVNNDGSVNISDVTALVNIILGK